MNYLFNIYHVKANKKSVGMQFQKIVSFCCCCCYCWKENQNIEKSAEENT